MSAAATLIKTGFNQIYPGANLEFCKDLLICHSQSIGLLHPNCDIGYELGIQRISNFTNLSLSLPSSSSWISSSSSSTYYTSRGSSVRVKVLPTIILKVLLRGHPCPVMKCIMSCWWWWWISLFQFGSNLYKLYVDRYDSLQTKGSIQ